MPGGQHGTGVLPKPGKYSNVRLMKKMGLNIREESVASIVAKNPDFLYSDDSYFHPSKFQFGCPNIACPINHSGVLNLVKYLQNALLYMDEMEITEDTFMCINNFKRSLILLMIEGNDLIGERVYLEEHSFTNTEEPEEGEVYYEEFEDNEPGVRTTLVSDHDIFVSVDTIIFATILRCCLFLQHHENYSDVTANHFPYVIGNLLTPVELNDVPIFDYNIKELFSCFNIVLWEWHRLRYSQELELYMDMLLTKLAMVAYIPTPKNKIPPEMFNQHSLLMWVLNDQGKDEYLPHMNVIRDYAWAYQSQWRAFQTCALINSFSGGVYDQKVVPVFSEKQKNLALSRLYQCDKEKSCESPFRDFVLQSLIRPGERQHYLSTRPNKSTRVDRVLRARPGDEALIKTYMETLALETAVIAQDTTLCFDDCVRHWAVIQLASHYILSEAQIEQTYKYVWNYFDIAELVNLNQNLAEQLNRNYPLILQNFNWFGVYHMNRFYEHEDAISAVLHWMYIVWYNSLPLEGDKYFPATSILNMQLKSYEFDTCEFREALEHGSNFNFY